MKETDDTKSLFQGYFEDFEVTPPASVKMVIDAEIAQKTNRSPLLLVILIAVGAISCYLYLPALQTKGNHSYEASVKQTEHNPLTSKQKADNSSNLTDFDNHSGEHLLLQNDTYSTSSKENSIPIKSIPLLKTRPFGENSITYFPHQMNRISTDESHQLLDNLESKKQESQIAESSNPAVTDTTTLSSNLEDSTKNTDQIAIQESTIDSDSSQTNLQLEEKKNEPKSSHWFTSAYLGPQFNFQRSVSPDEQLKFNPSFRTSLEVGRKLPSNFYISTGIAYHQTKETFSYRYIQSIDSIYIGNDSVPLSGGLPDTSIYEQYNNYQIDTIRNTRIYSFKSTVISIPFHIGKTFELSTHWVILADLGATFNFYQTTRDNNSNPLTPEPKTTRFGINASMRIQAGYKINNWVFTLGANGSMYLKNPVNYQPLNNTNTRFFVSPQLGIHYLF
ncbi:hypothetical protein [Fluviicola sp.]|uniref:hypothetical protein n=1 Tax=Fluviicola sp. TaxID=1917219 RepID=UPI003D284B5E